MTNFLINVHDQSERNCSVRIPAGVDRAVLALAMEDRMKQRQMMKRPSRYDQHAIDARTPSGRVRTVVTKC